MRRTPTVLCLDIEDPITMRSHTATRWIMEEITQAGLIASCFLVAEKVRAWERLGLRDVIEAVKPHDLAFHSTRHSMHPTISEICESLPAYEGAQLLWGWEAPGWRDVERIMGRRVSHWGLTGGSWSPSLAVMLADGAHALAYSPICGEDPTRPCWFAGGLQFSSFFGGLDAAYHDDALFVKAFAQYRERIERHLSANPAFIAAFCCHPTRVVHHEFWDTLNFGQGRVTAPEQWKTPTEITPEQELTARANLRRYLRWLSSDGRLEVIGFTELARRFRSQKPGATRAQVRRLCERICEAEAPVYSDAFSAAEIMGLMADYVCQPGADMIAKREVRAPRVPPGRCSEGRFTRHEVLAAARLVSALLDATWTLPERVACGPGEVGIADYFVMLARTIATENAPETDVVSERALFHEPAVADSLVEKVRKRIREWVIHRPDLELCWIERETRLLSWTFKPAWTQEELARVE